MNETGLPGEKKKRFEVKVSDQIAEQIKIVALMQETTAEEYMAAAVESVLKTDFAKLASVFGSRKK